MSMKYDVFYRNFEIHDFRVRGLRRRANLAVIVKVSILKNSSSLLPYILEENEMHDYEALYLNDRFRPLNQGFRPLGTANMVS